MNAPIITDVHGDCYAPVPVEDLEEWRWLLLRLEDWLLNADPDTAADWAEFTGPDGPRLEQIIDLLGQWSMRMRYLTEDRSR